MVPGYVHDSSERTRDEGRGDGGCSCPGVARTTSRCPSYRARSCLTKLVSALRAADYRAESPSSQEIVVQAVSAGRAVAFP